MSSLCQFLQGCDYKAMLASNNCDIDGRSLKMRRGSDIPDGYTDQKYRMKTSLPYSGAYYPRRNSSVELPEDLIGSEGRDEYEIRPKVGVEVMRMDSVSGHPNPQPFGGKVREERAESWPRKYNNVSTKLPLEENTEDAFSNLARSGNEYHKSGDRGVSRQIIKVYYMNFISLLKSIASCSYVLISCAFVMVHTGWENAP